MPPSATGPTPHAQQQPQQSSASNANMAVEPPEVDDFGLPIRKYTAPPAWSELNAAPTPSGAGAGGAKGAGTSAESAATGTGTIAAASTAATPSSLEPNAASETDTPSETPRASGPGAATNERLSNGKATKDGPAESGSDDEFKDAVSQAGSDKNVTAPSKPESSSTQDAQPQTKHGTDEAAPGEPPKVQDLAISEAAKPQQTPTEPHHTQHTTTAALGVGQGISEYSHQQLTSNEVDKKDDDDSGWQVMPAYAPYDIYDDDNKLVAKEYDPDADDDQTHNYSGLGGAGKGYTKVLLDDDAESATSMDEHTQYLFDGHGASTSIVDEDTQRDAVSQLQATKDLLTEGQRVAYVGLTRLEMTAMVREAEERVNQGASSRTKKLVNFTVESMQMWSQKMMVRLYTHMDISPAEQIMIEQLSAHGVMPKDLTPVLMANARVKNPMAEKEADRSSTPPSTRPSRSSSVMTPDTGTRPSRSSSVMTADTEQPAEVPPPYQIDDPSGLSEPVRTPSQLGSTQKIDIDIRWTVLCDLFLVLIADSIYDSRSRTLLEKVAQDLEIPWLDICRFEKKVTDALEMQQAAEKENWNEEDHMESRRKLALKKRYIVMGLATVGGGLVIGLSAGLLAPAIGAGLAAGLTTITAGTASATATGFLAGAGGAAVITSTAATTGSIIGVRAASRRMGAVKTFEYRPLHNNKRVNLIVSVSGWMTGKVDDVRLPFSTVDPSMGDIYSVLWEPDMLTSMGDTINILATEALTQGLQQVLASTILTSLMAAITWPVVLTKLSYLIDNPWVVSLDRANMAGLILADSLVDRNLGTRPVTLVGYSLGSRVIFSCLQELAKKGAHGLVQNVYLFGSPIVAKGDEYVRARAVVSGRFVNGFNRNDWILGYLFRLTNGGIRRVAGLAPVEGVPGLENMDVSEFVAGHMDYRRAMPRLLRECGWLIESDEFTEIEDPDPDNHQQRQRELISEIEQARKDLEKEGREGKGGKGGFAFFRRKKAAQKQDWEVYEDPSKRPAGSSGKLEDSEGNNHGVLFDVDAIRAELAKEKNEHQAGPADEDMFQIREIKSTLPPMKLEINPSPAVSPGPPPAVRSHRNSIRETRSADPLSVRLSNESGAALSEYRPSHERQPSRDRRVASTERAPTLTPRKTEGSYYQSPGFGGFGHSPGYGGSGTGDREDEIQMTFETEFDDPKPLRSSFTASFADRGGVRSAQPSPALGGSTFSPRPEIRPSQTVPNITLSDPWAGYVDDDDDFGKEKEISMTFA